jgi:hypothetical protein
MASDEPPPPAPPPTPKAPAGWYPDPDGKPGQRYFDGFHWTDQFYNANAKTSLAPTKRQMQVAAAVVGFILLVIILGNTIGKDKKESGSTPSSSATAAAPWTPPTSTTPTYSENEIETAVIRTCQKVVKKDLKDPDSAKFGDDWKAWIVTHYDKPPQVTYHPENGDKLYSAGGSVNAKNGFGGYVGDQPYGCDASFTTNGDIYANAYSLNDILNPTTTDSP